MKTIILEGIATSGKTTIKNKIEEYLKIKGADFCLLTENETFMPILENEDIAKNSQFLLKILKQAYLKKHDYYIIERALFSFIYKTSGKVEDFKEIEDFLVSKNTTIILLTIDKNIISQRVFGAMDHRDQSWVEYVLKKGNKQEIIDYYIHQQNALKDYTKRSKLTTIVANTTTANFDGIFKTTIKELLK
jgi:thymidylate kinase